jgi:hypothetical protein
MAKSASETFGEIVKLSEQTIELMEAFDKFDPEEQEEVLLSYFTMVLKETPEDADLSIGFLRAAEILVGLESENLSQLLGQGLDHVNPDIRMISEDALTHLAEEGLDYLMPAVEGVLEREGIGAEAMPFILADLDFAEVPKIVARFLDATNPQVVAAALEAMVEVGDEDSFSEIETLLNDSREVELEEETDDSSTVTIGQLAREALDMIQNQK